MSSKRILLLSLFFFILALGLTYYVLPQFAPRLRTDSVPPDAYTVPWMRPNPSIQELAPQLPYSPPTFDIDTVMAQALRINMTFRIEIPNGTRIVRSTVYLGHDLDYLYVGGKFIGMFTNPASTLERTVPNIFSLFFDTASDGVLKNPESGSRLSSYITSTGTGAWIYHDLVWAYGAQVGRTEWILADNYYTIYLGKTQPVFAVGDGVKGYDNSTGTLIVLFSRYLQRPEISEVNALQMKRGERWVMGFLFELGYATNSDAGDYVDGWPRKTYPYLSDDSSWWPKLVIDLSNAPSSFSA